MVKRYGELAPMKTRQPWKARSQTYTESLSYRNRLQKKCSTLIYRGRNQYHVILLATLSRYRYTTGGQPISQPHQCVDV